MVDVEYNDKFLGILETREIQMWPYSIFVDNPATKDIQSWLLAHIGSEGDRWKMNYLYMTEGGLYSFKNREDKMLFALTWK